LNAEGQIWRAIGADFSAWIATNHRILHQSIWHCFGLFAGLVASILVSQNSRRGSVNWGSMLIFIFKSEANPNLRAFGGDLVGSGLPSQFKPWRAMGAVAPNERPPYNLPRDVIEKAIENQGFQLFRLSKAE
jgi:hypothetical protein